MSTRPTDTGIAIGYAVGGLGPIAVAGSLVGVRDEINSTNVALVLVVVVVLAAVAGGRRRSQAVGARARSRRWCRASPSTSSTPGRT